MMTTWSLATLLMIASTAGAGVLVDDTFADSNSQNQDLANGSLRLFNSRSGTERTDSPGSVRFRLTNAGGADAWWAYFTTSGQPARLGPGDKLSVSATFSLSGFPAGGQDIRFGVFDSLGTRNTNNLTGGMNEATFVNDPGYGLQFFPSGSGNAFAISRRTNLSSGNIFNSIADFAVISSSTPSPARQTLGEDIPYTLTVLIHRLNETDTRITVTVTGGTLEGLSYSVVESTPAPQTTFDYFAFRIGGPTFADVVQFNRLIVELFPAPPVIISQPQPSSLTVQAGSNVTLPVAASGTQLSYQWTKDGQAVPESANASAVTPTLSLRNVQPADAGSYAAVVTNPGGSVTSDVVSLKVSLTPVPPPPGFLRQPVDTNVPLGGSASLTVEVSGASPVFQWFRDGVAIPGATTASLSFSNAQPSASGVYTVLVSNSSGSVISNPARLLVVSTMAVAGAWPDHLASGLCIDPPISLTLDQPPLIGKTGRIRILREDGTALDTLDMSASAHTRIIGGAAFNYYPLLVSGNTVSIYPREKLAYGQTYRIVIDPGVLTDQAGAPFAGVADGAWRISTRPAGPAADAAILTVDASGAGDLCSVQAALDLVPLNNSRRVTVLVRSGNYTEILYVPSTKPFITVRGEDRAATVIRYANNANLNSSRALLGVDAADFTLENITLVNTTPKGGSQAEAFRGNNQRIVLNRVNLVSFQDTLQLQGLGFVTGSYIEGDVDMMWGSGAVYFQDTELKMVTSNGYYTQIRNPQGRNGNVYVNCRLTAPDGVTGGWLSRVDPGVYPYSQVVFVDTAIGPHIRPEGWLLNNAATAPTVQFLEFNSTDLNGKPLDVSGRAPFSRQLTAAEAASFRNPAVVLGGWAPSTKLTAGLSLPARRALYSGTPLPAAVTTEPAGLAVSVTYNGSTEVPLHAGTYTVIATIQDDSYQGTATATFVIDQRPVNITLSNLNQIQDGSAKPVTVNLSLPISSGSLELTYNGSASFPILAGKYSVLARLRDPDYRGSASATLTIHEPGKQPLPAFPGAEGAGALTPGGRGGDVYYVTSLDDSGPGTLRTGIQSATGPRTIVFEVSGTINLRSRLNINKAFLTIAGQTAPGDGITLAGWPVVVSNTHDVIIRYIRVRLGDVNCPAVQDDAFTIDRASNIIADHVSSSWSVDEALSVTESDAVTVQWSFITESMKNSCHEKGAHGYGSLVRYGSGQVSYHHNLYAHHDSRNPRVGDEIGFDFVNNVVYDWGGEAGYSGEPEEGTTRINYTGNFLIAGPSSVRRTRGFDGGSTNTVIYQSNNLIDITPNSTLEIEDLDWTIFTGAYTRRIEGRFDFPQVETEHPRAALDNVLARAGCSLSRDSVDERIVREVRTGGGAIIDSQRQVGGWPALLSLPAPRDSDRDGIPDTWELANGLNPNIAADGAALTSSGYTNLEVYLNSAFTMPR